MRRKGQHRMTQHLRRLLFDFTQGTEADLMYDGRVDQPDYRARPLNRDSQVDFRMRGDEAGKPGDEPGRDRPSQF